MSSFIRPVGLSALLLVASFAFGDGSLVAGRADPINYMFFYDRVRNYRNAEIIAGGLAEAAQAQLAYDEANYRRTERLFNEHVVPEEELKEADLKRKVSKSSITRFRHDEAAARAERAANYAVLPLSEGQQVSFERVYEAYKLSWDEGCRAREYRVHEAEAKKAFADYRVALGEPLARSGAITEDDLELRQSEQGLALADLTASQALLDTCHDDEPDLEFLRRLVRQH